MCSKSRERIRKSAAYESDYLKLNPPLSGDSPVNLFISAVYRTRPTLTRMQSWSVIATVLSHQASWLHHWAVRKLKSWSEWMQQCWKSDSGCVTTTVPSKVAKKTLKLRRRQQIRIRFLHYSCKWKKNDSDVLTQNSDASAVPVHTCTMALQWDNIVGNSIFSFQSHADYLDPDAFKCLCRGCTH